MRFAKYDNPLGKNINTPLLRPNIREGESIIDFAVANMLKEERVKGESRTLTLEEIGVMLGVDTQTIKRWCK